MIKRAPVPDAEEQRDGERPEDRRGEVHAVGHVS